MDVQTYSPTQIDALVEERTEIGWWHLTGFYGDPNTAKRPNLWVLLKHLRGMSTLPWLVISDFNEIIGYFEKEGGNNRLRPHLDRFVDTINWHGLWDIGFVGLKFTWLYQQTDGT